jgi:adenylate cyclase
LKRAADIPAFQENNFPSIEHIDLLNDRSFELRHKNTKESSSFAQQAITSARQIKYTKGEAYGLLNAGFHEFIVSKYQDAFLFYDDALKLFIKLNNKPGIAHAHYNISLIFLRTGDFDAAMGQQQESYQLRKELNDENGIASCKSQIGYINSQFGLDDIALAEYMDCLAIWRRLDNKAGVGNILMTIGILFTKKDRLKEAGEYLRASMEIRRSIKELNGVHGSANYLAAVLQKESKYKESLELLQPVLEEALTQEHPFVIGISRLRLSLAKSYSALHNYTQAANQLQAALDSAISNNQVYQLPDIYEEFTALYKLTGELEKALSAYERYHLSKEQILNLNAATRLKNLEVLNELKGRERELKIHLQKNSELKERNKIIKQERKISESLLLNILPRQTAKELKQSGKTQPRHYKTASVLFTDFIKFTTASEKLSPDELVQKLDYFFRAFDSIMEKHKIEKIKTIGDSYMAVSGIPVPGIDDVQRILRAGMEIRDFVLRAGDPLFNIRIGIHTGQLIAGVVGSKKFAYDVWGDTVNIASRMESSGESGQVNISEATFNFIQSKFTCEYRGKIPAKNKGIIDMYFVHSER